MSAEGFQADKVPEACPGTSGEQAGHASACAGCPNQSVCAANTASGRDPRAQAAQESAEIAKRLRNVSHKIVVLSGKGGVGKSTVSSMLARGLASSKKSSDDVAQVENHGEDDDDEGQSDLLQVGLLDVDICGPSAPIMLGVEGEEVHYSSEGWSPVFVDEGLSVMSVGFLLESSDQAVIWRGPKKNGLIKQFLRDVDWGHLDYLVVDTPPGTSDEHLSLVSYLKASKITGAVVVTTPQELSLLDVRKEVNFCKKVGLPIIGVVENMSSFVCPKCTTVSQIFPATTGGARKMCQDMDIPFLGAIPLDPRLARACDEGKSFLSEFPESPAATAYRGIIEQIRSYAEQRAK